MDIHVQNRLRGYFTCKDKKHDIASVGGFVAAGFFIWHLPSALNSHTRTAKSGRVLVKMLTSVRTRCTLATAFPKPKYILKISLFQRYTVYPTKQTLFVPNHIILSLPGRLI